MAEGKVEIRQGKVMKSVSENDELLLALCFKLSKYNVIVGADL